MVRSPNLPNWNHEMSRWFRPSWRSPNHNLWSLKDCQIGLVFCEPLHVAGCLPGIFFGGNESKIALNMYRIVSIERIMESSQHLDPQNDQTHMGKVTVSSLSSRKSDPKIDRFFRSSPKSRTPDAQWALLVLLSNHPSLKRSCPMCFTLHLETVPKKGHGQDL